MRIDIPKFIWMYEQEQFKTIEDSVQSGLEELLAYMNADVHLTDPRWAAYMLATTYHEVAGTWQPIAEYGKGKGRNYGAPAGPYGHIYYGRGLTQNTWLNNYSMLAKAWNKAHPEDPADFVREPDLLLEMKYSYWAMSYAMRNGAYTGVGLSKYFNDKVTDPINARRIINGTDKAEQIAKYYDKFMDILTEVQNG